jgi:hypothetical protein
VFDYLGEAEVEHLDDVGGRDHHIGGLDIAVDNSGCMRRGERDSDLPRVSDSLFHRQSISDQYLQRLPINVLHHDEIQAIGVADFVNCHDVRMVQRGCRAGLLEEAPSSVCVGNDLRWEYFDRYEAA